MSNKRYVKGNRESFDRIVTQTQILRAHALAEQPTLNSASESSLAANSEFRDAQNVQNWLGNIRISSRPLGGDFVWTAM